MAHLLSLQRPDGCWEGEMVWCPMILAQYVIVQQVVGRAVDETTRAGIVRHFTVTRTPDGAWGLHPESGGYVFVTTLAYVALRLLGVGPDDPLVAPGRRWLHGTPGGVLAIPTWGKLWLALLDLYDYEGIHPCPPELSRLPGWLPIHPRRYYCHTRLIYLAMAYLYGARVRARLGPIVADLRRELYARPYESIDFAAHRDAVAGTDRFDAPSPPLRAARAVLAAYEKVHSRALRRRALEHCFRRILFEQRSTGYHALSPVNGLLNCLAIWSRDPAHPDLAPSLEGLEHWRWRDEAEGVRYVGARSHTWDTAFAVQAILESPGPASQTAEPLRRAHAYLRGAQLSAELPGYREADRDPALGGWCFSDGAHRWPVSDCTAEAVVALLGMERGAGPGWPAGERMAEERLGQAAAFILARQNADGGFATYERRRGSAWLDALNPSEMFGRCMTERSYVECTGSAIGALARLRAALPPLEERLAPAIERGVAFLRRQQRDDGSVPGFWGINVTYGLFHFVKGLRAAGVPPDDPTLRRAADWLVAAQRGDGGWGEHYTGCLEDRYVEHRESQAVMTSWALLALLEVLEPGAPAIARGVAWLLARQRPDGSWPRQGVNGVFFGSAMLDYRLYPAYFPTWALARSAAATAGPDAGATARRRLTSSP